MALKQLATLMVFLTACHLWALKPDAPITKESNLESLMEPPKKPTVIHIGIQLIEVKNIEPASSESPKLTAQFKLIIQWLDERLAARESQPKITYAYQDDEAVQKLNQIFNPRISIVSGSLEPIHQHLRIFPNGIVTLNQVVNITVLANMQLLHFPFDSQIFHFRFASTYWDQNRLDLSLEDTETFMSANAAPNAWSFSSSSQHISQSNVAGHIEKFSVFNFLVYAKRDPRYFLWRLIIPLLVIVILSWNVFWMFEDPSAAFGNCIVFLLTVVAFHQIANSMLPMIPSFTFIDAIVFISYGFIIIPTFQVMITTKLQYGGQAEKAARIRQYCRWYVPIIFILTMLATTLIYFARV